MLKDISATDAGICQLSLLKHNWRQNLLKSLICLLFFQRALFRRLTFWDTLRIGVPHPSVSCSLISDYHYTLELCAGVCLPAPPLVLLTPWAYGLQRPQDYSLPFRLLCQQATLADYHGVPGIHL